MDIEIRLGKETDFKEIWNIFKEVIKTEDTYYFFKDTSMLDCFNYFFDEEGSIYVGTNQEGEIVAFYRMIKNKPDLGGHVCNGSFMVKPSYQSKGVGKALGEDFIKRAKEEGFKGIQFNYVVSNNLRAIRLWESLGFEIVGKLPGGFKSKDAYIDVYIMYRSLI